MCVYATIPGHPYTPVQYNIYIYVYIGCFDLNDMDTIDLNKFSLSKRLYSTNQNVSWPPRIEKGKNFIRGPLPLDWFEKAGMLPGRALCVALVLWYQAGLNKSNVVNLSSKILKGFGVDRYAKSRGLRNLENAGLVSVKRFPGRNPIVTIFPR